MRAAIVIALAVMTVDAAIAQPSWFAATAHRHRQHHRHRPFQHLQPPPPYDPTFCLDILTAFDRLPVRDLDAYVSSIPEDKRKQAARCLKGKAR